MPCPSLIFILKVSHNTFKRFNVFTDANERGVLYTAYRGSMTRSSSADASKRSHEFRRCWCCQANDVQTRFEWFKNGENMVGKIMQATLDAESRCRVVMQAQPKHMHSCRGRLLKSREIPSSHAPHPPHSNQVPNYTKKNSMKPSDTKPQDNPPSSTRQSARASYREFSSLTKPVHQA